MKGKRNNNNFEYEDQRQTFRLSPRQLRRDRINLKCVWPLSFTVYAAIPRAMPMLLPSITGALQTRWPR